jgi:hypothetical protein
MQQSKKKKTATLKPVKRAKGGGLKKGQTNNPNGRPQGAVGKASASVKQIISEFYLQGTDGNKPELERILHELRLDTENSLDFNFKISMAFKYLRFIAAFVRDEALESEEEQQKRCFLKNPIKLYSRKIL